MVRSSTREGKDEVSMNKAKLHSLQRQYMREHEATGDDTEVNRLKRIMLARLILVIDAVLEEEQCC